MSDYFRTQGEAPTNEQESINWVRPKRLFDRLSEDYPVMPDPGAQCILDKTLENVRGRYTKTGHQTLVENKDGVTAEGHSVKVVITTIETLQLLGTITPNDNQFDHQYKHNLLNIFQYGEPRTDRTGVTTVSQFGDISHKIDLRLGFPATTLKGFAFKVMKGETMKWMLQGKYDLKTLKDAGIRIWDQNVKPGTEVYEGAMISFGDRIRSLNENQLASFLDYKKTYFERDDATEKGWLQFADMKLNNWGVPDYELSDGDLGPIYGKQWRDWEDVRVVNIEEWRAGGRDKYTRMGFTVLHSVLDDTEELLSHLVIGRSIDQVAEVEKAVAARSDSRRIILSGWNVAQLDEMSLPPCHTMAQWFVSQQKDENGKQFLDCKMYQRSADFLLGVPFNIAQYALITEMLAHVHGLTARFLHHTVGDAHIYKNHIDQGFVQEILERHIVHKSAKLKIEGEYSSIADIPVEAVTLDGYVGHNAQKNVPIAK